MVQNTTARGKLLSSSCGGDQTQLAAWKNPTAGMSLESDPYRRSGRSRNRLTGLPCGALRPFPVVLVGKLFALRENARRLNGIVAKDHFQSQRVLALIQKAVAPGVQDLGLETEQRSGKSVKIAAAGFYQANSLHHWSMQREYQQICTRILWLCSTQAGKSRF